MTKKFSMLAAGAALLALAGTANAQSLQLTNAQMDSVTAGGTAIANAVGLAFGELASDTVSLTSTNVSTVSPQIAIGQSFAQAAAAGGVLFQAAVVAHADSSASLP